MRATSAWRPVRVDRKTVEAQDICSLELVPLEGESLPHFSAGAHIDVHLPGGITRQYSLCNPLGMEDRYQICVLREQNSRGGSAAVHERVFEGDLLEIGEPKNHFSLAHAAPSSLLIAGGIGITPIVCMADRLHVAGAAFQMHYAVRNRARAAFRERILDSPFASQVQIHFSEESGRIDIEEVLRSANGKAHLYVCGPQGLIDAVLSSARSRGWSDERLHQEYFGAGVVSNEEDAPFDVKLASSGKVVRVGAKETVLAALASAGVEVPYSCEQGVCGTCLTRILDGTPDHRDAYLTPGEHAANDQFTPCCSRAKSALLVLDL
ncbi:MAG: PDR/VanB family oxidoreductase [Burkholderiaceae bacterium]|nr:PDR/VanB family oxidoreductase [Burkholderiaceae bacterium]